MDYDEDHVDSLERELDETLRENTELRAEIEQLKGQVRMVEFERDNYKYGRVIRSV